MRISNLIVCCALLGQQSMLAAFSQSVHDGWMLKQRHAMHGQQTLYIEQKALRIDNEHEGISYIANAVSGKVTVVNSAKKVCCTIAIDRFHNRLMQIVSGAGSDDDLPSFHWNPTKKTTDSGPGHAEWYKATGIYHGMGEQSGYLSGKPYTQQSSYQLLISRDVLICNTLSKLLAEIQCTPDLHGVPLREITQYGPKDRQRINLITQELKPIKISAERWKVLQSYRTVDSINEVTSGDSGLLNQFLGK